MSIVPPHSAAAEIHRYEYPLYPAQTNPEIQSRPSPSSSSGTTALISDGPEHQPPKRSKEELGEPSEKQYKKAGVVTAATAGAGVAGATLLAKGANREPQGWRDVEVEGKHHIWHDHPGINGSRKSAIKKGSMLFAFITVWLWVCLSIFWGSTYKLETFLPQLTVNYVSFDIDANSFLNAPMLETANTQYGLPSTAVHLGWRVKDASYYPNGLGDVQQDVLSQGCWAAVVVNANATSAWREALATGDASYDPTGAITIYLQSARFYQVVLLYIVQLLSSNLQAPLSTARENALQSFVTTSSGNAGALTLAAQVPQALGVGFGYNMHDLRSIKNNEWAGAAPEEAALIYYIIFAFYIALFGAISRMKSGYNQKLTFTSMLKLRFSWTLFAYFFMSLWFTLIERAWQIPMENYLGHGGFPALWALNLLTLIATGWAMETMISILGIPFFPFFLILWIILNITSSFYPIEMMPRFYRFLRWVPFYHNSEARIQTMSKIVTDRVFQGYKIIAFGTDLTHRLGLHYGILFAVIAVELIGLPLAIYFERWKNDKNGMQQAEKKRHEEEEKHGRGSEGRDGEA